MKRWFTLAFLLHWLGGHGGTKHEESARASSATPQLLAWSESPPAPASARMRSVPRTLYWRGIEAVPANDGTLPSNSIKLLTPLGTGGMGTVWLGFDQQERTYVAVKMILPHLVESADIVGRFHREIRILERLRGRGSVKLRAAGTVDGQPFAVMDRVPGTSLSRRTAGGALLPIQDVFHIVSQLLLALAEIHAEGITHRDVKPSNIMLSGDGLDVTLIDFGVAASRDDVGLPGEGGTAVGTASHMSPEQLLAEGHGDGREDLWAAAVVAYECLLGRLPFAGPSFALAQILTRADALALPTALRSDFPPPLERWFARAFARDIDDRFADANEMRAAWESATSELSRFEGCPNAPQRERLDPTTPADRVATSHVRARHPKTLPGCASLAVTGTKCAGEISPRRSAR